MEEPEVNEIDYARGYNQGWLLSMYESELAKELRANIKLDSDLASGLFHGIVAYDLEQENKRTIELNEIRENDAPTDLEPDREEIPDLDEPEQDIQTERLNDLEQLRGEDQEELRDNNDLDAERDI